MKKFLCGILIISLSLFAFISTSFAAGDLIVSGTVTLPLEDEEIDPSLFDDLNLVVAKEVEDYYNRIWEEQEIGESLALHIMYTEKIFTIILEVKEERKPAENKKYVGDKELQSFCDQLCIGTKVQFGKSYSAMPVIVIICSKEFETVYVVSSSS